MLPTPNPVVICKPVSDGAVLFHTAQEVYFGLNSVGARIWELLPPRSRDGEELIRKLQVEYPQVEASVIRQDVTELLDELATHDLVFPSGQEQHAISSAAAPAS